MRLRITHDTRYRYEPPVLTAVHMTHLTPPPTRCQDRLDARLEAIAARGVEPGVEILRAAHESVTALPSSRGGTAKLLALLGFSTMPMIDATIVNVAAPSIARDLPATPTQLQFVVGGYLLAYGSLIITGSRWGARHGLRSATTLFSSATVMELSASSSSSST